MTERTLSLMGRLRRLLADRRGVAATEFAILAPVLLACYFLSMEMSQAVEVSKKVGRIGSMVGDLIAQQPEMTNAEIRGVMQIGEALLQPYNRGESVVITVTAIQMSDEPAPKARVEWSRRLQNGELTAAAPFTKGTLVSVPDKLLVRNGFLIRVTSSLAYKLVLTWSATNRKNLGITNALDPITMGETYYLRPRQSDSIPCTDC